MGRNVGVNVNEAYIEVHEETASCACSIFIDAVWQLRRTDHEMEA